ncbi:InlB B-repeat-containing protein [Ruminococcaceae bacterium OttesenSCG-928-L11]|nr:InlB B-repeat-containing protein [Ruminococcaceae bacterium OttesenSCG-928-L11]
MQVKLARNKVLAFALAMVIVWGIVPVATLSAGASGGVVVNTEAELRAALSNQTDTVITLGVSDIAVSADFMSQWRENTLVVPDGSTLTIEKELHMDESGHMEVQTGGKVEILEGGVLSVANDLFIAAGAEVDVRGRLTYTTYSSSDQPRNEGTITVTGQTAILSARGLDHAAGGEIHLRDGGLAMFSRVSNAGRGDPDLALNGDITVSGPAHLYGSSISFMDDGIELYGDLSIDIEAPATHEIISLHNDATFTNYGTITLEGEAVRSVATSQLAFIEIPSKATMVNHGTIKALHSGGIGVRLSALPVYGTGARLINETDGEIQIANTGSSVGIAVENYLDAGTDAFVLENKGSILLKNAHNGNGKNIGIINGDAVDNTGSIVSDGGSVGFYRREYNGKVVRPTMSGNAISGDYATLLRTYVYAVDSAQTASVSDAEIHVGDAGWSLPGDIYLKPGENSVKVTAPGYKEYTGTIVMPATLADFCNVDYDQLTQKIVLVEDDGADVFAVTFHSDGGSAVAGKTVNSGETVERPADPSKEDCIFAGWYREQACVNPWDFDNDVVTGNITLYAKWTTNIDPSAPTYALTVQAGTGGRITGTTGGDYAQGQVISISAAENSNYRFAGWSSTDGGTFADASQATTGFTMPANATTVTASFVYTGDSDNTGDTGNASTGGSGSRGGSTRSDSGTAPVVTTPATSANVGTDGLVKSAAVQSELTKALTAATGSTASVRTRNASSIAPATLKAMADTAAKAGKATVLLADTTTADGAVQGRLYVEPSKLSGLTANLKLGVYTDAAKTSATKAFFEKWFQSKVAVIRCEQQGSFGARLQMAAKVDLKALNTKTLVFYSYDKASNTYTRIQDPQYSIDSNGYLHFYTDKGGDIIIADKPR